MMSTIGVNVMTTPINLSAISITVSIGYAAYCNKHARYPKAPFKQQFLI
jgi:hypothetical protein